MTQRLLTVPIVLKSDVLPYTAPFHLGGQIGVHLSWTPTLGRWWCDLSEGWRLTMPFRLHSEIAAETRDTYVTQGGRPVAVDVVVLPGDEYVITTYPGSAPTPGERKEEDRVTFQRHQSVIDTDYHQFMIEAGPPRELIRGQYPEFPLALFADDLLRVRVGVKSGLVNVTAEVHDDDPGYDDSDWEDSAEGDLIHDTVQGVNIVSFWDHFEASKDKNSGTAGLLGITPPGKRRYRVRIYARGKNIYFDGRLDGDPVEDYLIQMWPTTEPEPPRQIKRTSGR